MLGILAAYADGAAIGLGSALVEHENPLASCGLKEGAARNDNGLLGLTKLQINIVRLACADILRALTSEDEVTAEFALAHFWIYLANLKLLLPLTTGEGGYKALADSVDVVLVYAGLNLIVAEVIQLAYLLARTDALA